MAIGALNKKFNQPAEIMDKLYIFGKVIMSLGTLGGGVYKFQWQFLSNRAAKEGTPTPKNYYLKTGPQIVYCEYLCF